MHISSYVVDFLNAKQYPSAPFEGRLGITTKSGDMAVRSASAGYY